MAKKVWLLSLLAIILVSLGFFSIKGFAKEKNVDGMKEIRILSEKIDEVLKNQQGVIERLEDIRAQQDIIRVRASRQ